MRHDAISLDNIFGLEDIAQVHESIIGSTIAMKPQLEKKLDVVITIESNIMAWFFSMLDGFARGITA
jgi:hypothetical protein